LLPEPEVKRVFVVVVPPVSAKVDDENVVHVKVKYVMKFVALLLEIDVTTDWAGQLNENALPPVPPRYEPAVPAVDVPASRK